MLSKEYFLFRMRAIVREVTCMTDATFQTRFEDSRMSFSNHSWGSPEKTLTQITMIKVPVELDEAQG